MARLELRDVQRLILFLSGASLVAAAVFLGGYAVAMWLVRGVRRPLEVRDVLIPALPSEAAAWLRNLDSWLQPLVVWLLELPVALALGAFGGLLLLAFAAPKSERIGR